MRAQVSFANIPSISPFRSLDPILTRVHTGLSINPGGRFNPLRNPTDLPPVRDLTASTRSLNAILPHQASLNGSTFEAGLRISYNAPVQAVRDAVTLPRAHYHVTCPITPSRSGVEGVDLGCQYFSIVPETGAEKQDGHDTSQRCWEHGCNGRRFSTRGNFVRHQKERANRGTKVLCPACGAIFSRTTARDKHLINQSCGRIRRYSNGRIRPLFARALERRANELLAGGGQHPSCSK